MIKDRRDILVRLQDYYTKREAQLWLNSPHPQLEGAYPVSRIVSGKSEDVHEILDRLDSCGYL